MVIYNPFRKYQQAVKVALRCSDKDWKSKWHNACDFMSLYAQKGLLAEEYLEYDFDQRPASFRKSFLGLNEQRIYLDLLNPQKYYILARNKYFAHKMLENVGIRKAELYGYYQPEGVFCENEHTAYDLPTMLRLLRRQDVHSCVIKATEGSHGDEVFVVEHIDFSESDAQLHLFNGMEKKLSEVLSDTPLLFESLVQQTEQLASLNPSSVNTVRFMTLLYPTGEARLIATFIKIGRAGSCVDNAGTGGNVDACVDTETGMLKYAIRYDGEHQYHDIDVHPDTQTPINGMVIEHWAEIKKQVLRYQQAFPYIKAAGWDIAITDEGPVVIEVNDFWDRLGQLFLRQGWRNEIRDCYLAWKNTGKHYYFGRKNNMLRSGHLEKITRYE
ncbi:MAG: hypothetical protein MJZ57_00855 [Bacteroidales bacterium]|nr:hypothetical protein [Bacteroidales bacterium]